MPNVSFMGHHSRDNNATTRDGTSWCMRDQTWKSKYLIVWSCMGEEDAKFMISRFQTGHACRVLIVRYGVADFRIHIRYYICIAHDIYI